jgi:hypothetical protein
MRFVFKLADVVRPSRHAQEAGGAIARLLTLRVTPPERARQRVVAIAVDRAPFGELEEPGIARASEKENEGQRDRAEDGCVYRASLRAPSRTE